MNASMRHDACRFALFVIWLMLLTPVYSADALELSFNPDTDMNVTDISANISWTTDQPATGLVKYGVDDEHMQTERSDGRSTSHFVRLTGISPETTFQFFIEGENSTGGTARSPTEGGDHHSFTTDEPWDRTPPHAVKGLAAPTITQESITITWERDERDGDIDHYNVYIDDELVGGDVKSKSYSVTGLNASEQYTFRVSAVDTSGNEGPKTSVEATTRSEDYEVMVVSGFDAEVIGTSVYVTFSTNIEGHTRLKYGQNPLVLDQKKEDPEMVTSHNMTLKDLPANTDITLKAESCDAAGNCGNSSAVTVTTTEKVELFLDLDGMDCDPGTLVYANTNRLDVRGRSSPGADVNVFINGDRERFKRITETGEFSFAGMNLDPGVQENQLRVVAADHVSADEVCEERVLLDYYGPEVHFDNETENLKFSTEQSVRIKGNVTDETKVTLNIYLQSLDDTIPPPAPENINATDIGENSVTISWDAYGDEVDDLYRYFIYRTDVPGGPIVAVESTKTEFTDENVSTATTYTYQVVGVDRAGNEGSRSSPYSVTTLPNGTDVPPRSAIVPDNPSLVQTKEYTTANTTIQFTETVSGLFEGKNTIRMEFIDQAGNVLEEELEVSYDSEPPQFISPDSLQDYSPSYVGEVLVRGQVNKPTGEVWVWVNPSSADFRLDTSSIGAEFAASVPEEPVQKVQLQENGTFEVEVSLGTSVGAAIAGSFTGDAGPGRTSGSAGASASGPSVVGGASDQNRVVMVAVDSYGRPSQPLEGTIEYTPCGTGQYWSVSLNKGGNVINTRELLEGVAAYGFGFELEWIGGGNAALARATNVRVTRAQVSPRELDDYDFDWLAGEPRVMCRRGNCTKGFVMINFAKLNPEGETYLEKEQNLSDNRVGECWPAMGGKGPGCIQLLLEMQIDSDPSPLISQYGATPGGPPVGMQPVQPQKQCMLVQIMLDERIDFASSEFVKDLLRASLNVINSTLDVIEMIETPLKYATQITLGVCLLSHLSKFIVDILVKYKCKWSGALKQLGSSDNPIGGALNMAREIRQGKIEKVAEMHNEKDQGGGACNIEFPESGDSSNDGTRAANEACVECASWKDKKRWLDDKWHLFCDRVMCPSVPSLQHYIYQNWDRGRRSLWSGGGDGGGGTPSNACSDFNPDSSGGGSQIYSACECGGDSCGPSDSNTAYICRNDLCMDITSSCSDGEVNSLCRCGEKVCVPGQTCSGGSCVGRESQHATCSEEELSRASQFYQQGMSAFNEQQFGSAERFFRDANDACASLSAQNAIAQSVRCQENPDECSGNPSATGSLITDINSESASLPDVEEGEPGIPLITGFTLTPGSGGSEVLQTGASGTGASINYDQVLPYAPGAWEDQKYRRSTSDCSFAEQGRGPISQMWEFYDANKDSDAGEVCSGGHMPQPACCPFEYMNEWGWGMMFSNEVKMSYCLAEPQGEDCGIGQTIQRGVTGICNPQSEHPRATYVVLDDLEYTNEYHNTDEAFRQDVAYLIELDESGNPDRIQRAWFTRSDIRAERAGEGRIEIQAGTSLIPDNNPADIAYDFPTRDNADISRDSDEFQEAMAAFRRDLESVKDDVKRKSSPRESGDAIFRRQIGSDDAVEHWFRQVYGLLGNPGRQYLAQPAGSFIQSILTLCLSGIYSWLIQFKNMLILLQQCFQTILVTGDGSSGQCQALISQYICDLLKEAISCISQRLGGSARGSVGIGGVSGFFGAISDASRGVTEEAQARYGDQNLFSTTFSAENVLHDACIYMFTGEWPTDWRSVFETAATLPINSSGLVFPVTRRWQAYDPQTGYSRYVYRVAYSFFAGADVQYDVKLVCSGPNAMCDMGGGVMEPCDCSRDQSGLARYYQTGRRVELPIIRHQSGDCPANGVMSQGQFCSDEILFVAEGQPLRYDKAVIEYRPTQAMGPSGTGGATPGTAGGSTYQTGGFGGTMAAPGAVTGRIEGSVREIGGPPPGLCEFSLVDLSFRCGIEVPPTGYARFVSVDLVNAPQVGQYGQQGAGQYSPTAYGTGGTHGTGYSGGASAPGASSSYQTRPGTVPRSTLGQGQVTTPLNTVPYGIGDSAIARVRIAQQLPGDTASCSLDCQHTKYFVVSEIRNQNNVKIYPRGEPVGERLNEGRMYDWTVFDPVNLRQHEPFVISEEMFGARGGANIQRLVQFGELGRYITGQVQAEGVVPPVAINITIGGSEGSYTSSYVLGTMNPTTRRFQPGGSSSSCETPLPRNFELSETMSNPELVCGGFRFRLNAQSMYRKSQQDEDWSMADNNIFFNYEAAQSSGGAELCPQEPKEWTMVVELRDADSHTMGGAGYQMSQAPTVDFETGEPQRREIRFRVVCREGTGTDPQSGSIEHLVGRSAVVGADNDEHNKVYGLWVDSNTLASAEEIGVSDFAWVDASDHSQGFRINIDSRAEYGVLNIDVGRLGLIPSPSIQILKADTVLSTCGAPPCIAGVGDANDRVIRLRLSSGDPIFTFRGFRAAEGIESIPEGGIVLTRDSPSYAQDAIRLHDPIPQDPSASSPFRAVLDRYEQRDDGFSINYRTEPVGLMMPGVSIGFDLSKMGYTVQQLNVIGVPGCGVAGAQPSADGTGTPSTSSEPAASPGGSGSASGDAQCRAYGDGTWRCSCSMSDWPPGTCNVANGCLTGKCFGSYSSRYCCSPGATPPSASTDNCPLGTEIFGVPCTCGSFTIDTAGHYCYRDSSGGKSHSPMRVPECSVDASIGSSNLPCLCEDVLMISPGMCYMDGGILRVHTGPVPDCPLDTDITSSNTPCYCDDQLFTSANYDMHCTWEGPVTIGYAVHDIPGITGMAAGPEVSEQISSGQTSCYSLLDNNVLVLRSLGTEGATFSVSGLSRRSVAASVANIAEAPGNSIILTAARPDQHGVRASGLSGQGRVTLSGISAASGQDNIRMNVQVTGQTSPVQLVIELLPLELRTKSDTAVSMAGRADALGSCSEPPAAPCLSLLGGDRIAFFVAPDTNAAFSISNLQSAAGASAACVGKNPGEVCDDGGITGTCWEPNIPGIGLQCFTECRKNYALDPANRDSLMSDPASLPANDKFCLPTSRSRCDGASWDDTAGLCPEGRRCCPNGRGRTLAPSPGTPGATPTSEDAGPGMLGGICGPVGYRPFLRCDDGGGCTSHIDYPNLAPEDADNTCGGFLRCCYSRTFSPEPLQEHEQCGIDAYCERGCPPERILSPVEISGGFACSDYTVCCEGAGQSIPEQVDCSTLQTPQSCHAEDHCIWVWDPASPCFYNMADSECMNPQSSSTLNHGECAPTASL